MIGIWALASNSFFELYQGDWVESPQIAMNAAGNAFAVWRDSKIWSSGSKGVILALKYDVLTGFWQDEAVLLSSSVYDSFEAQVAINNNGDAIAVWKRDNVDGSSTIQANRYDASTGSWQSPSAVTNLSFLGENVGLPQIAMNDEGAIAVWQGAFDNSYTNTIIQANRYDGSSWQNPSAVTNLSDINEISEKPQIAMSDESDAIVVWRSSDADSYAIQACKYDHKSCDWLSVDTIFSGTFPSIDNPQVCNEQCNSNYCLGR